jgi:hypothetical protein
VFERQLEETKFGEFSWGWRKKESRGNVLPNDVEEDEGAEAEARAYKVEFAVLVDGVLLGEEIPQPSQDNSRRAGSANRQSRIPRVIHIHNHIQQPSRDKSRLT